MHSYRTGLGTAISSRTPDYSRFIRSLHTFVAHYNEFTIEGYFSLAFPTLYPTGAAEFLGQSQNEIAIGYYSKHLIMYYDGRFAKHPRFHFFALNTEMQCHAYNNIIYIIYIYIS